MCQILIHSWHLLSTYELRQWSVERSYAISFLDINAGKTQTFLASWVLILYSPLTFNSAKTQHLLTYRVLTVEAFFHCVVTLPRPGICSQIEVLTVWALALPLCASTLWKSGICSHTHKFWQHKLQSNAKLLQCRGTHVVIVLEGDYFMTSKPERSEDKVGIGLGAFFMQQKVFTGSTYCVNELYGEFFLHNIYQEKIS